MHKTIIEARRSALRIDFAELYAYRDLLWALTYRDLRVRYAQTFIGFLWVIVNPLFSLFILTFVFGMVAKIDVGSGAQGQAIPHLLYTMVGLTGWTYFSESFAQAGTSVINAQQMVQKIYFPRLMLPLSKALTALVDLGVSLLLVGVLLLYYGFVPDGNIVFLPLFVLLAIVSGLAGGIWISALTIRFRDFQYVVPMLLRVGMYLTPIAYPSSAVPEKYQLLYYLNPIAGIVEGMRWAVLGGTALHPYSYISFAVMGLLFLLGLLYFNKVERVVADII